VALLLVLSALPAAAQDSAKDSGGVSPPPGAAPFRYPEGKHGKGELRYRNGLPVLVVAGTPEEMGEQAGVLAVRPAAGLLGQFKGFLKDRGWDKAYPLLIGMSNIMLPQFPRDHLAELGAVAKHSGFERDLFVFVNTIPDVTKLGGCSTLVVEAGRSATGAPLFGRNLDWPPFGPLHEYTLVTVYRPAGKRAFAAIGLPGLLGCVSGINDAGLALALNEITEAADGSPRFDPRGTPLLLAFRRVLEECATVGEAEKLLRSVRRTTYACLTLCDRSGGAVFEITPKSLVVRRAEKDVCACTNHFCAKGLAVPCACGRLPILEQSRELKTLGVAEVAKKLHAVNQGAWTLQTMIFEPARLRLHLAFGKGPATALPPKSLDLGPLFTPAEVKEKASK
jgi:hypothetical protein